jgi:hypothetical protein
MLMGVAIVIAVKMEFSQGREMLVVITRDVRLFSKFFEEVTAKT